MTDILNAAIALASLVFGVWTIRRTIRSIRRARQTCDAILAATRHEHRPEPGQPGTDADLLLECIAVYGDCEELDRLRDAITQHRKEQP